MTLSLRKSVWWTPILIATSNISNNWLIHKCCPSGLFWKMLSSRKIVMIFLNAFGSYFSFLHQVIALGTSWKMLAASSKLFFQSQNIHTFFLFPFFPSVRRSSRRWSKLNLNPTQDGPFWGLLMGRAKRPVLSPYNLSHISHKDETLYLS